MGPGNPETESTWAWAMMEKPLSDRERALRDLFVNEYLKDRNVVLAAMRCGFGQAFAKEWGTKLYAESYVQKRIDYLQNHAPVDEERLLEYDRRRIETMLFEAAASPYSTGPQVSALKLLATIKGMNTNTLNLNADVRHRGGVMLVPAIANLDEWEKAAIASQQALMEDASADIR